MYYQIAVPSPLRQTFDYLPPGPYEGELDVGTRVVVPFGRRNLVGLVLGTSEQSSVPEHKLKPISAVLDHQPLLSPLLFDLLLWAARYYQHPAGDALSNMLPTLLRQGEALPDRREIRWQLSALGKGLPTDALARAPRQQQLLNLLQQNTSVNRTVLDAEGISRAVLKSLEAKNLVECITVAFEPASQPQENLLAEQPLVLYEAQQQVMDAIELHGYRSYLLEGETGSGKTEIYLQTIEKILRYGRQALVLVPEISLTPQTVQRFKDRFNRKLAVMHSGLTDRERLVAWDMARTGEASIVIGTRSAIFTPLKNPGVIIVDEEHDPSFKQHEGFRYHARDLAVVRAHREGVPILLGSATPALESLHNSASGRYHKLELTGRPGNASLPEWELLDIRKQPLTAGFSVRLLNVMEAELKSGNQVLVFINRRGFAPTLMCHDCGWVAECPSCDVRMTVHREDRRLLCHHCEHQRPVPVDCPLCFSRELQYLGQGTERSEAVLESLFPAYPVIRVDRDTTRRKHSMQAVAREIAKGQPCLLVGTQILAKGHHFPGVTLVAILDADGGLFSADFRAVERMGQLITQVAGRAGRGDRPGRVMLQTHHSDHPLVRLLSRDGYRTFARELMRERELAQVPPYRYMALLRAESSQRDDAESFLRAAREQAQTLAPANAQRSYLGPLAAPLEKRSGRYRYQLALTFASRADLQNLLSRWVDLLPAVPVARKVRWSVDVDPQDMT